MDFWQLFKPSSLRLQLLEGQQWTNGLLMDICVCAEQLLRYRQLHLTKWLSDPACFPLAQTIISTADGQRGPQGGLCGPRGGCFPCRDHLEQFGI